MIHTSYKLKNWNICLNPKFCNSKTNIWKNYNQSEKDRFNFFDRPTDVTYKLTDSNKNEIVQHRNNLLPYYPKEYAPLELTQLYSFTGFKDVHDNSDNNQKQTNDINCRPQILETKNKQNNRKKSQEITKTSFHNLKS